MKIFRAIGIILVALLLVVLAFYLTGHGEQLENIVQGIGTFFKNIWHWIVGLFGFIVAAFKRIGDFFGPSKAEKEIREENEAIKKELQEIRSQTRSTDETLAKDRAEYEAKRKEYETKIAESAAHAGRLKAIIADMKAKGSEEYIKSLDPIEKDQFEKDIHKDVAEIGEPAPLEKQFPAIVYKEVSRVLTLKEKEDKANEIGVEPAAMLAVIKVESSGGGFLSDGRPKILFEGHIFWRQLKLRQIDPAPLAGKYSDIIYPNWVKTFYQGGVGEYDRLGRACAIHNEAALASASWGLFQIMGFNHTLAGFGSVRKFVDAHYVSESEHLNAFCKFIKNQGILPFLVEKNWEEFARRYNGSGQVAVYAGLLKKAYEDIKKT